METLVTDSPVHAASFVAAGEPVAFPTETVYGLGANAFSKSAVEKIYVAKGRPADNPLIVHVGRRADIDRVGSVNNIWTRRLIDTFFPGPLTIVVERSPEIPRGVTAGLDTVGIRMPDHPIGRAFLLACDIPLAAPSANLSGRPSPTTWTAVYDDLQGRVPCILNGGQSTVGLESTVVDCTGDKPVVLRQGAVSLEAIRKCVPSATLNFAESSDMKSPGLRHRHYAPRAEVILVENVSELALKADTAYIGLDHPRSIDSVATAICPSVESYAFRLFDFFRHCERTGIETIVCQLPPSEGIGAALRDRLTRAAEASAQPRV